LIQVANLVYIDYVYRSESNSRSPYWHTKSSTVTHHGIGAVHFHCLCPWSTDTAVCRNQSAGCASSWTVNRR